MDRLDGMRLFTRIVERRSFTAAAADLGIPRSTATEVLKQLEARLGVQLLHRTTRLVKPTPEGATYHERCVAILADVEGAEDAFRDPQPSGQLHVDAPGLLTRTFLLPHLPEFLARYSKLRLRLGQSDRLVDLLREGVDCVLRVGTPSEHGLVMKRLGVIEEITCASPEYLREHGTPRTPKDLTGHLAIGFFSSRTHEVLPLELRSRGKVIERKLETRITVDNSDTGAELARLGLGLIQAPRYRFARDLADGTLVEVLHEYRPAPTPLVALYPQSHRLSPRVRVFLDWVAARFAKATL